MPPTTHRPRQRLLLIEDDPATGHAVKHAARSEKLDVLWVPHGGVGMEAYARHRPDIVILDRVLPGMSGVELSRTIRARSSVPIIMLTARMDGLADMLSTGEGPDVCFKKPVSPQALRAGIREALAHSRRTPDKIVETSGVRVDRVRREVHVNGSLIRLAPREFDVLSLLILRAGQAISRQEILRAIWGNDDKSSSLDVHIARIRRRIEADPARPTLLQTVRGIGYRFRDQ